MNEMWNTRTNAMNAIKTELQTESSIIYQAFSLLDEMLSIFHSEDTAFYRTTGLTLLKTRNLAQSIFSLDLDGFAQEAGALLRPLIECLELLTYFNEEPERINEALDDKLPTAGVVGKRIHGKFQKLRDYLNEHASHFSFAFESMSHLIDFESGDWKVVQSYNKNVLRTNMRILFAILLQLLFQAANILVKDELLTDSLEGRLNSLKKKGHNIYSDIPR